MKKNKNYYKPVKVSSFWTSNYIECESKDDRNKTQSIKKFLIKLEHT